MIADLIRNWKLEIKNSCNGFTLIELLVVIAIIGILSTLLMANFVGIRQRARDGQRKSDLRQMQSALEMYRADITAYPNVLPCGSSLAAGTNTYMSKVPCDPLTGLQYSYLSSGSIYCLRACLENTGDSERDELSSKYGSDNPTITGCEALSSCASGKSFTLQNP